MDKKKILQFFSCTLLPPALYVVLFQPFHTERVTELTIHTMGALKAIGIAVLQLGVTIFTASKITNLSLSGTGRFFVWSPLFRHRPFLIQGKKSYTHSTKPFFHSPYLPGRLYNNFFYRRS